MSKTKKFFLIPLVIILSFIFITKTFAQNDLSINDEHFQVLAKVKDELKEQAPSFLTHLKNLIAVFVVTDSVKKAEVSTQIFEYKTYRLVSKAIKEKRFDEGKIRGLIQDAQKLNSLMKNIEGKIEMGAYSDEKLIKIKEISAKILKNLDYIDLILKDVDLTKYQSLINEKGYVYAQKTLTEELKERNGNASAFEKLRKITQNVSGRAITSCDKFFNLNTTFGYQLGFECLRGQGSFGAISGTGEEGGGPSAPIMAPISIPSPEPSAREPQQIVRQAAPMEATSTR